MVSKLIIASCVCLIMMTPVYADECVRSTAVERAQETAAEIQTLIDVYNKYTSPKINILAEDLLHLKLVVINQIAVLRETLQDINILNSKLEDASSEERPQIQKEIEFKKKLLLCTIDVLSPPTL